MASGIFFQFDASHHAVVTLLGLGTTLVLPLVRVPLLKLLGQGAKIVLPTVLVIWRKWAQISTANAAAQEVYTNLGRLPASVV